MKEGPGIKCTAPPHNMLVLVLIILFFTGCWKKEAPFIEEYNRKLREFKSGPNYSAVEKGSFTGIPDSLLEETISMYINSKSSDSYEEEYALVKSLPEGYMTCRSIWVVQAEVNNGGFNQLFWNSTGIYAADAKLAFKKIGASGLSSLVGRAIEIRESEKESIEEFRKRGTLDAFSESYNETKLSVIDSLFYATNEDVSKLLIDYIRSNEGKFVVKQKDKRENN